MIVIKLEKFLAIIMFMMLIGALGVILNLKLLSNITFLLIFITNGIVAIKAIYDPMKINSIVLNFYGIHEEVIEKRKSFISIAIRMIGVFGVIISLFVIYNVLSWF